MSLNCWCNVSTSSKLPNLYKVHNETPADQHFTSNRRSVVRNSVLVLFLDDSELPVVYAWVCVPAPFLCRHFPNKKRHSLSQEVIIHSVISWGVFFFFFLTQEEEVSDANTQITAWSFFTLYTFSFTRTSLWMLQHQMFASASAKLSKSSSELSACIRGEEHQPVCAIMKRQDEHFICGWTDFMTWIWSELVE